MTDHKAQRLQHVAELLNAVGRDTETKILSTLEEANPNLASQIRKRMFTFDDLTLIDNRQMQVLLKELDPELLVLSLKTASGAVKELIFSGMSSRAADGMKDDLENLGHGIRIKPKGEVFENSNQNPVNFNAQVV